MRCPDVTRADPKTGICDKLTLTNAQMVREGTELQRSARRFLLKRWSRRLLLKRWSRNAQMVREGTELQRSARRLSLKRCPSQSLFQDAQKQSLTLNLQEFISPLKISQLQRYGVSFQTRTSKMQRKGWVSLEHWI